MNTINKIEKNDKINQNAKDNKIDKKLKLLLSAKHLFATKGFEKTSIRDIANHAQVNSSMISYYFGGKSGLIPAIFDAFFPKKSGQLKIVNPEDQLENIIRTIILLRKQDSELVDFLHREITSNENMAIILPYIEPFWIDVRALLVEGKKVGVFKFNSIEVAFKYIQASMSYPYHLNLLNTDSKTQALSHEFVDELVQLVMKGMR